MKPATIIRATIAAAIALTVLGAAAPAAAAGRTLPPGDTLYTIDCDSVTLYSVDAATAAATPIGAGDPEEYCAYDPAYDFSTGASYVLIYDGLSSIAKIDLTTGLISAQVPVTYEESPFYVDSLTIDRSGKAFATRYDDLATELFTIDLATGVATHLGVVPGIDEAIYGLATHPLTGQIFGIEDGGDLFIIDPVALTATFVDTFTQPGVRSTWGLDIDSSGVLWIVTDQSQGESSVPGLWSASPSDLNGTAIESGWINDGEYFYTFTALIVPGPALAATGIDATPLLAGAVVLGLAGVVLLAMRRRAA